MADFKPKLTVSSNLPSTVDNGSLIVTTDTGDLYVDAGGNRIKISDVINGTYASITALESPLAGKLYFATDTHQLLQATYSGNTVVWTVLNGSSSGVPGTRDQILNRENCTESDYSLSLGKNTGTDKTYALVTGNFHVNKFDGVVCNNNNPGNLGSQCNPFGSCGFKGFNIHTQTAELFRLSLTDIFIAQVQIIDLETCATTIQKLVVNNCELTVYNDLYQVLLSLYDSRLTVTQTTAPDVEFYMLNGSLCVRNNNPGSGWETWGLQLGVFYTISSSSGTGSSSSSSSGSSGN